MRDTIVAALVDEGPGFRVGGDQAERQRKRPVGEFRFTRITKGAEKLRALAAPQATRQEAASGREPGCSSRRRPARACGGRYAIRQWPAQ